jgi:hypothetical protein
MPASQPGSRQPSSPFWPSSFVRYWLRLLLLGFHMGDTSGEAADARVRRLSALQPTTCTGLPPAAAAAGATVLALADSLAPLACRDLLRDCSSSSSKTAGRGATAGDVEGGVALVGKDDASWECFGSDSDEEDAEGTQPSPSPQVATDGGGFEGDRAARAATAANGLLTAHVALRKALGNASSPSGGNGSPWTADHDEAAAAAAAAAHSAAAVGWAQLQVCVGAVVPAGRGPTCHSAAGPVGVAVRALYPAYQATAVWVVAVGVCTYVCAGDGRRRRLGGQPGMARGLLPELADPGVEHLSRRPTLSWHGLARCAWRSARTATQ